MWLVLDPTKKGSGKKDLVTLLGSGFVSTKNSSLDDLHLCDLISINPSNYYITHNYSLNIYTGIGISTNQ